MLEKDFKTGSTYRKCIEPSHFYIPIISSHQRSLREYFYRFLRWWDLCIHQCVFGLRIDQCFRIFGGHTLQATL